MTKDLRYDFKLSLNEEKGSAYLARMVGYERKVLEVGCATGSVSRILKEDLACNVTGVEIDPVAAERAASICDEVIVGDIESIGLFEELKNRKFEVVTFGDVLEHLRDPLNILRKARALLTEDGFVGDSVPNITHASVAFEIANGRFEYRRVGLLDETHIRFFSRTSVLRMFSEAGYIVTEFRRAECVPEQTEFQTHAIDDEDRSVLEYFRKRNPEANTYQFVLKAIPNNSDIAIATEHSLEIQRRIDTLERQLAEKASEVRRLRSEISWLESRWPIRWIKLLRNGIGR